MCLTIAACSGQTAVLRRYGETLIHQDIPEVDPRLCVMNANRPVAVLHASWVEPNGLTAEVKTTTAGSGTGPSVIASENSTRSIRTRERHHAAIEFRTEVCCVTVCAGQLRTCLQLPVVEKIVERAQEVTIRLRLASISTD